MQEVMTHPWMVKGFNGPPDNYLPAREPLAAPLDNEVVQAMQGFNFGSPESIKTQLLSIIESDEYKRAIKMYQREREAPQTPKDEKKRGVLDFYKRRNSQHSRDTLTGPSSEALQIGNDPLNAFSPLLSIYYLVKEKHARDQKDIIPPPTGPAINREKEKEREKLPEERRKEERREKEPEALPELAPPQAAHTNSAAYEMPGERPTGGRTRPRARTHGEDDVPETVKGGHLAPPEPKPEKEKRPGGAAGLLRRFSTRRQRKEPERERERDRSHPPVVQVQAPAAESSLGSRRSFSVRRSRRDEENAGQPVRSGSSQPHRELLSPPMSAGGNRDSRRSGGLGRSTSVNSADVRRHQSTRLAKEPPATSGSEQSVSADQSSGPSRPGHGHSKSVTMRAKSLGHARRESIQQRRQRREAAQEANVPEETDVENEQSMPSSERLDDSELAKPVFLKGLFSVSTTSGKSVPAIRADIRRVLKQLNVDYTEIKGGFTCKHAPSIDLNKMPDMQPNSPGQPPQHRRRFSFGGMRKGEDDGRDADQPPRTPRTPGRSDRDRSYSNSETSVDSIPRRTNGGTSRREPGETSTQVQSDLGNNMVLEWEIFIVKVPLLSLYGIQFKRMTGNTWQYKSMADQILKELRL